MERGERSGLVPPPCGEGLGRGLSWTGNREAAAWSLRPVSGGPKDGSRPVARPRSVPAGG
ncbi:hypothetical protein CO666_21445 [Rhizobium chutanense]|uniref:Uncharacterized protein n=1 Tax=Rhizobium chutanense TaxID=2035448 RepID=A0A2A6J859_9HYPH|nr:hypothetical protein CO666_21445 [Rhizobium chutanense]